MQLLSVSVFFLYSTHCSVKYSAKAAVLMAVFSAFLNVVDHTSSTSSDETTSELQHVSLVAGDLRFLGKRFRVEVFMSFCRFIECCEKKAVSRCDHGECSSDYILHATF